MRILFAAILVAAPTSAQVTAQLAANTPISAAWTQQGGASGSTSFPAGPLVADGSLVSVAPLGLSTITWTVPTVGSVACVLDVDCGTNGGSGPSVDHTTAVDLTFLVSGPVGQRGHVRIVMNGLTDFPLANGLFIDVGADGSFEASAYPPALPLFQREWCVPVVLGASPLAVRILHAGSATANGNPGQFWTVGITFVPWSVGVNDLGSACPVNDVGWVGTWPSDNHPYFLFAAPAAPTDSCRLVARGHGFSAFLVGLNSLRMAPGWIGTGCDDLLVNPAFSFAGTAIAPGTWEFVVPALPPGMTFFVQHASLGPASGLPSWPPFRAGVTNLVEVNS
ncbi:MAG: hypothetical protein JNK78_10000 [Planctomycetes bacterium]|nr:hypothetical protein [Planctomycetota bacterium]